MEQLARTISATIAVTVAIFSSYFDFPCLATDGVVLN